MRMLTMPCQVSGQLQDCCCQAETVDDINNTLYPLLQRLVKTTFFKYYKVCECIRGADSDGDSYYR